ncbi:MAG: hypothetical protein ACTSUE_08040, partial [Promethearchaeota archaeon]
MNTAETCIILDTRRTGDDLDQTLDAWIARVEQVGYRGLILDVSGASMNSSIMTRINDARARHPSFILKVRTTIGVEDRSKIKRVLHDIRNRLHVDYICI